MNETQNEENEMPKEYPNKLSLKYSERGYWFRPLLSKGTEYMRLDEHERIIEEQIEEFENDTRKIKQGLTFYRNLAVQKHGDLIQKIDGQSAEIEKLKKEIESLKKHVDNIAIDEKLKELGY